MHIIQHELCRSQRILGHAFPDLAVAGVSKQANADHYISIQRQLLLGLHKRILEPCAAAQGYHFVITYHPSHHPLRNAAAYCFRTICFFMQQIMACARKQLDCHVLHPGFDHPAVDLLYAFSAITYRIVLSGN